MQWWGMTLNGALQAFSQNLKSGRPKCAVGPAQMSNC